MRILGGWGAAALLFVLGFGYLVATPPYQAPDEPMHYFRAYRISRGQWVEELGPNGKAGGKLPSAIVRQTAVFGPVPLAENARLSADDFWRYWSDPLTVRQADEGPREFSMTAALYSPLPYLPQAVGLGFARLLDLGIGPAFYLARLMNLLCASMIAGLALSLVQRSQALFLFCLLAPMAIFQSACTSPDSMTNALGFLNLCLAARFLEQRPRIAPLERREWLALSLAAGLALCKTVYGPIALLPLAALWASGFSLRLLLPAAIPLAAMVGLIGLYSFLTRGLYGAVPHETRIVPTEQWRQLITAPWRWPLLLVETWNRDGTFLTRNYVGLLGWLDVPLPRWALRVYLVGLNAGILLSGYGVYREARARIVPMVALLAVLASVSGIALALYLHWTPVGASLIEGLQGRYFLPVVPALVFLMPQFGLERRWPKLGANAGLIRTVWVSSGALVAMAAFLRLLERYWT